MNIDTRLAVPFLPMFLFPAIVLWWIEEIPSCALLFFRDFVLYPPTPLVQIPRGGTLIGASYARPLGQISRMQQACNR